MLSPPRANANIASPWVHVDTPFLPPTPTFERAFYFAPRPDAGRRQDFQSPVGGGFYPLCFPDHHRGPHQSPEPIFQPEAQMVRAKTRRGSIRSTYVLSRPPVFFHAEQKSVLSPPTSPTIEAVPADESELPAAPSFYDILTSFCDITYTLHSPPVPVPPSPQNPVAQAEVDSGAPDSPPQIIALEPIQADPEAFEGVGNAVDSPEAASPPRTLSSRLAFGVASTTSPVPPAPDSPEPAPFALVDSPASPPAARSPLLAPVRTTSRLFPGPGPDSPTSTSAPASTQRATSPLLAAHPRPTSPALAAPTKLRVSFAAHKHAHPRPAWFARHAPVDDPAEARLSAFQRMRRREERLVSGRMHAGFKVGELREFGLSAFDKRRRSLFERSWGGIGDRWFQVEIDSDGLADKNIDLNFRRAAEGQAGTYLSDSTAANEKVTAHATDPANAERLWNVTEKLIGETFSF
ncbi:hypothetical protein C8R46DRAFT_1036168 [Mycena filopes]|nr:hypothetical protein C8R46DRAFT_1036168 [Mycena filopes]